MAAGVACSILRMKSMVASGPMPPSTPTTPSSVAGISSRWLVRQGLQVLLQLLAHRRVQIDALGRDRRLKPLLVQRLELPALDELRQRVVNQLLERRVVLAQHDRVG